MITGFSFNQIVNGDLFKMGIDLQDIILMLCVVIVVFIIGILKEKGVNIRESISNKNIVIRWALYYALILSIIIFGCYGFGVTPLDPMYANF